MLRIILLVFAGLILATNAISLNRDQAEGLTKSAADFASSIQYSEVVDHLNALQNVATSTNGNRAVRTAGFNGTVDYITNYLAANTNLKVTKTFFYLRTFQLLGTPTLTSNIDGTVTSHVYSSNLAAAEFYHAQYTVTVNINTDVLLTAIPNDGCTDADWLAASPAPAGIVALVKRGTCTFVEKVALAAKYKVAALLLYNDGSTSNNIDPIYVNIGQNNRVPTLFLSYTLGQALANAANSPLRTATIRLSILTDSAANPVANVCADTLTGDPTKTIIVGSHSDSVTAGPGINDNGSGSSANLALATTLSRLLQTPDYAAYPYRVRFCWWGAEELGLLGADYHVSEAKISTVPGERISDYLVNINLDMLGSPNFIFGIYDGTTAPASAPAVAKPGSVKMTALFRGWFDNNQLPWDYTSFDGRSDYGPFLAAGVAAGGLFSGADGTKTVEQRNRYNAMLGSGLGGTSGVRLDICYHRACDTTTNINQFALEKMVRASGFAIESLGREADLTSWLYPGRNIKENNEQQPKYKYDSINEFFGLPYY